MDRKAFTIIFIVILVIGVGSVLVARFSDGGITNPLASPSPSTISDTMLYGSANPDQTNNMNQADSSTNTKTYQAFPGELAIDQLENKKAVITVAGKGQIEFEIYPEATKAASNFIALTNDQFYDGLTFHRVEPGFVIQGGDPAGNGTGGPGYTFEDEPVTRKYDKGIVAMANRGPDTNGSQFFIMLENNPLPPNYTIFGKVITGQSVVDKVTKGDVMESVTIQDLK